VLVMAGNFASANRALRNLFLDTSAKCILLELHLSLDMALLLHNLGQFVLGGVAVLGLNRVIFTAPLMCGCPTDHSNRTTSQRY
jgi:hypothetical protein